MKYTSYKILPEKSLILCNYQGHINMKDVMELTLKFTADPEFKITYHVLLDFRHSTAIGFKIDIADYVNFLRNTLTFPKKIKVGILYATPNQEFLLKIYKGFGKFLNLDIEIFKSYTPCIQWMNFQDNEAEQIRQVLSEMKSKSDDFRFS